MFFAPSKSRQRAKIWIMGISKTSEHIQIKIKMPNPSQEPPASPKDPNEDSKDIDVLCTFKIKIEPKLGSLIYKRPVTIFELRSRCHSQLGTSSVLQRPKSGLKGHGCSLHLQNQDGEQKFGTQVYLGQVTITKSRSRCQTPVRNLQHLPNPQIRT